FGGEALIPVKLNQWKEKYPGAKLVNMYGITETTVHVTFKEIENKDIELNISNIGTPIPTLTTYVLGKYLKVVPLGVTGELCVGGKGVGRGYLNRPELTKEKFVNNPYIPDQRLYRSGDLGRFLGNGEIEYLGRIDHQVKIRGYRIELGEIESELLNHDRIKEVVVVPGEDNSGDKYLCAYLVTHLKSTFNIAELRGYLSRQLPDYMIPSYFVFLEKLPLTSHGKVDFKALPGPEFKAGDEYVAPRNAVEEKLTGLWSKVLGVEKDLIGIDNNFFEWGGQSLKATVLTAKMHKAFNVKVPLAEIFKTPSIRGISQFIIKAKEDRYASIEPVEKKDYYALSSAQKRLYILQQMELESTAYNMPQVIPFPGEFALEKLEENFIRLINHHESLRTSFHMIADEPVQRIHDKVQFEIEYYDLQVTGEGDRCRREEVIEEGRVEGCKGERVEDKEKPFDPKSQELRAKSFIYSFILPFDLSQAPLLKVGVLKTPDEKNLLLVDMHHIICDGVSGDILETDFMALDQGEGHTLTPLRIQYKDFSGWQNTEKETENIKQQESYWLKEFSYNDQLPVLNLPYDYPRPLMQSFEGSTVRFGLNERETQTLKDIAREAGATLYMSILSVYTILLSKLSGDEDIIVGSPIIARRHADLYKIIGMFANTLAMRNYPSEEKTFKDFLIEVKERTLEAFENQEYQFEDLVDNVSVQRDTSRNPIFDVMFNLLNQSDYRGNGSDSEITGENSYVYASVHRKGTSKFDLNLAAVERGKRFFFSLEYCTKLFKSHTIDRIIDYFKNIISGLSETTVIKLSEIEIITGREKEEILKMSMGLEEIYDTGITIHRLFKEKVKEISTKTAVVFGDKHLSYGELNRRADQLACMLREKGVKQDIVIGLLVERSIEMIPGILGIMKAGGAYLPIDMGYPEARKKYMLQDSEIKLLLTNYGTEGVSGFAPDDIEIIDIRDESIYCGDERKPEYFNNGSSLVYVIYTSGSTGNPKGVMLEHRNLVNLITYQYEYTNIDFSRVLQFNTISFDVSFQEIFSTLIAGGKLFLIEKETRNNIPRLFNLVEANVIKTLFLPASYLKFVLSEENYIELMPGSVDHIVTAGEQVVITDEFRRYLRLNRVYLHNHYGPSEAHVVTTLTIAPTGNIPELPSIGKPVANTIIYILDKGMYLVPVGVPGELYIGGIQVGRGYLRREELTSKRFIASPFGEGERIYQTGDLARWLSDGNIEFLGRIDHQVKIRGFRVELGEIERNLLNHDDIRETVVVARVEGTGDNYLCAYIVSELELEISGLRQYLSKHLPDYMIPTYFMQIEKIPLTPNGKVDRRALPAPELKAGEGYVAPGNAVEEILTGLCSLVLGVEKDRIGIDSNFFEWGGQSLKATVLTAKMHKAFNVRVPLAQIFKTPSVRGISQFIIKAKEDRYAAIEPVEKKDCYALSSAQKRLYLLHQMELESTAYNMPAAFILEGVFEKAKLEDTSRKLIHRHESLRTSFHMVAEEPVQRIHEQMEFAIEYYDLATKHTGNTGEEKYKSQITNYKQIPNHKLQITNKKETKSHHSSFIIHHSFIRPFDLTKAPLLRVGLIHTPSLAGHRYILIVDMHHIVSDGISMDLCVKEFMSLYSGEELPPLKIQYKDFSGWQKSKKERESIKKQEDYWLREFSGEIPVLNLPYDFARPVIQDFAGSTLSFGIGKEETGKLKHLALTEGSTLYMVLLTSINVFLEKVSGQEKIVVGSPTAGRRHPDLEQIIGMFVNTLALRSYPAREKTVREFLKEVKDKTLKAQENQDYPFEDLVEKAAVKRDAGRNPLFDVMFVLQNMDVLEIVIPGLRLKPYRYANKISKFDLTFYCEERVDSLVFTVEYSTKLFRQDTIKRFTRYFNKIVSGILNNPEIKIGEIEFISGSEKRQLLVEFNDTRAEYPKDKVIHGLFEEQVEKTPASIAVAAPGWDLGPGPGQDILQLSYEKLNRQSDKLARVLRSKGVYSDEIVGIMVERSIEMMVGIMSILKSGGAYLPLDPQKPASRSRFILQNSNAKLLLTGKPFGGEIDILCEVTCFTGLNLAKEDNEPLEMLDHPGPTDLAYLMYTSGSTGTPRGVMIEHRSVLNRLHWMQRAYPIGPGDVILQKTPFDFDVSVWELFWWSFQGASLFLLWPGDEKDPEQIVKAIKTHHITTIHFVPSMLNIFLNFFENVDELRRLVSLKRVFSSGEALGPELVKKFHNIYKERERKKLVNLYGPTEATVDVSYFNCSRAKRLEKVPIGKPIDNIRLFVLDNDLKLLPVGICGELHISGAGLARGYLNQVELTKERFLINPFFPRERLYCSGDLARWLAYGDLEFLGRIDHQVKIRGFRVELGEIESHLLNHDHIGEAVVLAGVEGSGDQYLCAYIVSDIEFEISRLREYLSKDLPGYMIPTYFMQVEKIPLTPNGKVDRRALPAPELKAGEEYIAPGNAVEEKLTGLWSEVLGVEKDIIGIDSNFFEWGGQSLRATVLTAKMHKAFSVKVPLAEIFKRPTIRRLSRYIEAEEKERYIPIEPAEEKEYYSLSSAQQRLYLLQQMDPESTAYNMPTAVILEGGLDKAALEDTSRKLIHRHESLRTSFHMFKDEPVQRIQREVEFEIEFYDYYRTRFEVKVEVEESEGTGGLAPLPIEPAVRSPQSLTALINSFIRPFDLSQTPLLRVGLIKIAEDEYILTVDMHHIISDGTSMQVFVKEFMCLYGGEALPYLRIQYRDFSQWQKSTKEQESIKRQEQYWFKEFAGETPILNLPLDFARSL
ncbi:MAG: amino acid adenylation domain-containing protein, partial [Candidatus Aminicenantes bacterium]